MIKLKPFFLALKRGAGLQGLGAMQKESQLFGMPILRPLLSFSRNELEHYVQQENLSWVEDESNQDNHYDSQFLRNQILLKYVNAGGILIMRFSVPHNIVLSNSN